MNGSQETVHATPPPMVNVKGSHCEMGQQVGEFAREQIKHSLDNAQEQIRSTYAVLELTWEGAKI